MFSLPFCAGKATLLRNLMTHTESENDISLYLKLLTVFYVKQLKVEKLARVELKTLHVQPSNNPVTNISDSVTVHKPQALNYTEVVTSSDDATTKEMTSLPAAVTSSESASPVNECFPSPVDIPCLTCKLFAPLRRGPKTFESFSRTVDRASYWIKCNSKCISCTTKDEFCKSQRKIREISKPHMAFIFTCI